MFKNILIIILFILLFDFVDTSAYANDINWSDVGYYNDATADYKKDRMRIVTDYLNKEEQSRNKKRSQPEKKQVFQSSGQTSQKYAFQKISAAEISNSEKILNNISSKMHNDKLNQTVLELGTELSRIAYREPDFMREKGYMYGIFGSVTHRISENNQINKFSDMFSDDNKINVFKVDGKISWGRVNYESSQGTLDGLKDSMFEIRGTAGYDLPISTSTMITPYMGVGFRYLKDDLRGTISTPGGDVRGYRRSTKYLYVPMGLDTTTRLKNDFSLGLNLEYDIFINGKQKSHLEDVDPLYETLTNGQGRGYGVRGSFSLKRDCQHVELFFEPFVRYWSIRDSEASPIIYDDAPITDEYGNVFVGIEPQNNSTEYGIKLGLNF